MTRNEMIDALIERDLSSDEWSANDRDAYLADLLRNGFIGYSQMLTADIEREYKNAFEPV